MEGANVVAVLAEADGPWERSPHTSEGLLDRLPLLILGPELKAAGKFVSYLKVLTVFCEGGAS